MGCKCEHDDDRSPTCQLANGADEVLLNWNNLDPDVTNGYTDFLNWCHDVCICWTAQHASEFQALTPEEQAAYRADGLMAWEAELLGLDSSSEGDFMEHTNLTTSEILSPGTECSATACSVGDACSGDNCTCQVTKAQYVPGAGSTKYYAECGSPFSSGSGSNRRLMRRHEEDLAYCPCNSTYISEKCCSAKDGLVWEAPEFKLGELADDWDL